MPAAEGAAQGYQAESARLDGLAGTKARSARQMPQLRSIGFSYKLKGDNGASNIDPFANGPASDNHRVVTGPHIIIFVPNVADIADLPSDPESGGPFVMWQGTPYAHIMVPVAASPTGAPQER